MGDQAGLRVVGLFAGIGGIELGLHRAGHQTELLCEVEPMAQAVLRRRFPGPELVSDIRCLRALPSADVVAAGFPCQDLSQAGRTAGIGGQQSGLVHEVFRLLDTGGRDRPTWLVLENVPFMLPSTGGAMRRLVDGLEELGYSWAYRWSTPGPSDYPSAAAASSLASTTEDPRASSRPDAGVPAPVSPGVACGFYWTEGHPGARLAVDAVPTLKGGSTIGIPSPPAIWIPTTG